MQLTPVDHTRLVGRLRAAGCVFAEEEAQLLAAGAGETRELESLLVRRLAGIPLEQVLGWAEFCGLRIMVEPGVFVPRRRTEFLATRAAAITRPGDRVVDLCCGTGAVAARILQLVEGIEVYATDIDPAAVRCAEHNLAGRATASEGDLFDALPLSVAGRLDVVVVNAPYVPSEAIALMPPEARNYEPVTALDGGTDGLDLHRRIAAAAAQWLASDGILLIETSRAQRVATLAIFREAGFAAHAESSAKVDATIVVATRRAG